MLLLDILATLIIATLSGMGVGSGGLMVLYLTFLRGAPQLTAQGFNLLFFLFAVASGMAVHLSRRRLRALPILLMIAAGLPAAYLGSTLALHLPDGMAARIFGVFLIFAGLPALKSAKSKKETKKS